uniref:Uncharacterized protein n=1 Tax=viral metagenome TaxID=1070528 RepID=A0A2V0RCG2_9ZZZZ
MSYTRGTPQRIAEYADEAIESMRVVITPLSNTLSIIGNATSFDMMREHLLDRKFDRVFHLMLYIETATGIQSVERLDEVHVETKPKVKTVTPFGLGMIMRNLDGKIFDKEFMPQISDTSMSIELPVPDRLKFGAFMDKVELTEYNIVRDNSQTFIAKLLEANKILSSQVNAWINRDVKDIISGDYLANITHILLEHGMVLAPFRQLNTSAPSMQSEGINMIGVPPIDHMPFKQGKRIALMNKPFMRSHGRPIHGSDVDRPEIDVMFARRKKRMKGINFKKIGKSIAKIGAATITGDVATVGTNEILKAVGSKQRVPTNTELINRGLAAVGSKGRVPGNPLLTGVIDRGGITSDDDRAKTIF